MRRILLVCLFAIGTSAAAQTVERMYAGFRQVPDSVRTKTWWFHGEDRTTREGITADLEGFKRAGLQGVVYYDQQHGQGTEHSLKAMSREWWQMLKFAALEAKRLGLSFDINISNGYCCGGPWITPELGMQCVRSTETTVKGGEHYRGRLPQIEKRALEDIAVLAFPLGADYREAVNCLPSGLVAERDTVVMLASFDKPYTARSLSYNMTGWSKGAQSIVNIPCDPQEEFFGDRFTWQPPIGELEVSDDSLVWHKACTLHSIYRTQSLRPDYTISFPAATGRFFRLHLHDWTPRNGGWMVVDNVWQKTEGSNGAKQLPLTIKGMTLSSVARIDRWEERAGYFTEYIRPSETPDFQDSEIIRKDALLDITQHMNSEGELDWTAPEGCDWRIVRFTNCFTGGASKHGRKNLLGPEADKLSTRAAEVHWRNYTQQILDTLRAIGCKVGSVCMDSHEAGSQNWTHDMPQLFREKYGYDILPWLPAMQGYVVGSVEETEQFLRDLRRCIADGINERYIATLQRLCTENGVEFTCQATGNGQSICSDNLSAKCRVDRPQGEFWTRHHEGSYDTREAASAAHIFGKPIASAEAFTDFSYTDYFGSVKDEIDMETVMQVNEFVICASAHQPWLEPTRIMTAYNRDYAMNRKNTLWPFARPFFDYQARNHYMMRQGKPVVDVLVYVGDEAPMKMLGHRLPEMPEGYDFDVCSTYGLSQFEVSDSMLCSLRSQQPYRVLAIEKSAVVRPETEALIAHWKALGLPVFDNRKQPDGDMEKVLRQAGIRPDVAIRSRRTALDRVFTTHRRTADADIYYLVNHSRQHLFDDYVALRTAYDVAEYWDALTGERFRLPAVRTADGLRLRLRLRPTEAGFVVVSKALKGSASQPYNPWTKETAKAIEGEWTLTFDRTLGGPDSTLVASRLTDFTKHADPAVKYFSGLCKYDNTFALDRKPRAKMLLRIPGLHGVAHVVVNGKEAGYVWCSPWELDITRFVRKGRNRVSIEVRNSLVNRLVGDAALPESQRSTWIFTQLFDSSSKLIPSGIEGQVLLVEKEISITNQVYGTKCLQSSHGHPEGIPRPFRRLFISPILTSRLGIARVYRSAFLS